MALFRRRARASATPPVTVRAADTRDLDAIVSLLAELVADRVPRRSRARYMESLRAEQAEKLLDRDAAWFVAERDASVIGCARVSLQPEHALLAYLPDRRSGYVYGLFVRAGHRRSGAGKALLERCEKWVRERGIRWLTLHSTHEAVPFYDGLGWEPTWEFAKKL